jgi:hypothetical protein
MKRPPLKSRSRILYAPADYDAFGCPSPDWRNMEERYRVGRFLRAEREGPPGAAQYHEFMKDNA